MPPPDEKTKEKKSEIEQILESVKKLGAEMKTSESNLKKFIKAEIKASEERLNERLSEIDNKITLLSDRVTANEDDIGHLKAVVKSIPEVKRDAISSHVRHYELVINGVEWKQGEHLKTIFEGISRKLGFAKAPPVRLIRFKQSRKANIEPSRRPIKVLFSNLPDKHNFMENVKRLGKNLLVNCIDGFENLDTRLYVQECLDTDTYRLKNEALNLKRNNKLAEVSIINLQLYVRVNKESVLTWIADKDALKAITG